MNRAMSQREHRVEFVRGRGILALLVVAAMFVAFAAHGATCVPSKVFTSWPNPGPGSQKLVIDLPPAAVGADVGWLWQSDNASINNFSGGCSAANWFHKPPAGAYIHGQIESAGCTGWTGCPFGSLTLALEDRSSDFQEAYLIVLQTDETPIQPNVFDFTDIFNPPPAIVHVEYSPYPGVSVLDASITPSTMTLTLEFDDFDPNFHGAGSGPFPPRPWHVVHSYDLYAYEGPADPGRDRGLWGAPVASYPYPEGGVILPQVVLGCPPPGQETFLALGVRLDGGVGGPVSLDLVGAGTVAVDTDEDTVHDCHDSCLDRDGDSYGSPGGGGYDCLGPDCDDDDPSIHSGATQHCDGVNNDCDHPLWPLLDETNEADDDQDGLSECAGDCDDADPNNWISCAGCSDPDEDGVYLGCDAYVTIEGPDNCPTDYNPAQTDDDLDDHGPPCDCDDTDPQTHPGAQEVNDGQDNQCPGDDGHGVIDEVSGAAGYTNPDDGDEFCWPAQPGATSYEVARSTTLNFSGDCSLYQIAVTCYLDFDPPPSEGFYYLVRALTPNVGSWGQDSAGDERVVCP